MEVREIEANVTRRLSHRLDSHAHLRGLLGPLDSLLLDLKALVRQSHLGRIISLCLEIRPEFPVLLLETVLIQARHEKDTNNSTESSQPRANEKRPTVSPGRIRSTEPIDNLISSCSESDKYIIESVSAGKGANFAHRSCDAVELTADTGRRSLRSNKSDVISWAKFPKGQE
jgi:hypothetical protein